MTAADPGSPTSGLTHDSNSEFMRLFSRHCDQIKHYIGTLLPQAADADEVFQETSITLWRKFDTFEPDGNFAAWACGVAFNLVRNYRRVESRRPVFLVSDEVLDLVGRAHESTYSRLADHRGALASCLDKLSPADRALVARCYGNSGRLADVAHELGRTANALYKQLKIIRRRLFDCIHHTLAMQEGRQ